MARHTKGTREGSYLSYVDRAYMYIIIKSLELLLEKEQYDEMIKSINNELKILENKLTSITIDEVLKVMGFNTNK